MSTTAKVPPAAPPASSSGFAITCTINQRLMPRRDDDGDDHRTWVSQAITVAAELGLADALADGPLTIDELSRSRRGFGRPGPAAARIDRERRSSVIAATPLRVEFPCPTLCSDADASMRGCPFYGSREQRER